jgi:thioesterase domain-containing protein
VHPAIGLSWSYSRLITNVPPQYPIYGLQARNLASEALLPQSIEEIAADYLKIIREIQPIGPYNLLGWSFGGLVAHSMAIQLQVEGDQVSLLTLLDSYPAFRESLSIQPAESSSEHVFAGTAYEQLQYVLRGLRQEGHFFSVLEDRDYQAIAAVYENNLRMMQTFIPQPFDGDVLLVVAAANESDQLIDSWRPYVTGRIEVVTVDCSHDSMLDALPAQEIGNLLANRLNEQPYNPQLARHRRTK